MEFVRRKKLWYLISLLVIMPGLISLMLQGLNLSIDYKGGNLFDVEFTKDVSIAQLRSEVDELTTSAQIQEAGKNEFIIKTVEMHEEDSTKFISALQSKLGEVKVHRNEKVSGVIGKELTQNAIIALLIAFALMVVYVGFRFEFLFGICAVIALIHDVLVTVGVFSLFQIEVDASFIAALLTIIGYSINDTIVIFDRIRENMRFHEKESLIDVVNLSVNQTLFRSITTALTVIIALMAILLFGGETTRVFALAMLIGSISGAYSSIFIASPLWIDLKQLVAGRKKAVRELATK